MKITKYQHLFIDLDKTIWDFESNTNITFREIFEKYDLPAHGIKDVNRFFEVYNRNNELLWALYRENKIKKEVLNIRRFELSLQEFGVNNLIMATHIAEDFITLSPQKTILFPNSYEALGYLKDHYSLHIITNGFEEVQHKKLDNCDLRKFFTTITTSEEAGVKKPESGIFEYALRKAGARSSGSLMIGDDLQVDMEGARNIGINTLYFNPGHNEHTADLDHEIHNWKEIIQIL
jgi:putative hydrolase of the HAD superfamily